MHYDLETDIFFCNILPSAKIKKTFRFGKLIIHVSNQNAPVLIEVLGAGSFLKQFLKIKQNNKESIQLKANKVPVYYENSN